MAAKKRLEKAKKKEAAFIVTIAKREQEIADLKAKSPDHQADKPEGIHGEKARFKVFQVF
ncbi:hypothetical protein HanXRQr2_Chr01g0010561 [Helianthus annuus]|uniref:Uncharacterized protein n=1 Tax=Helianthus annuus TaxID=4232 RepID=A0A251VM80_HELAN|nr:hypothetical protein HanXRQr2_Chr01g0010561 [Helianthus annuus]KAJ0626121.1 hypothetical protein HanHA89_Chr01g0009461 [Helianthus annuus]KAJ0782454.1 hypothetical protein HanLR1_Chr01g0008401 [Helianthus annuus]